MLATRSVSFHANEDEIRLSFLFQLHLQSGQYRQMVLVYSTCLLRKSHRGRTYKHTPPSL